ncbi:MAG: hypothetical protein WCG25_09075 [bacterium]
MGFFLLITESLLLVSVFTIASTASSCHTICSLRSASSLLSFVISSSLTMFDGIHVLSASTFHISVGVIVGLK